MSVIARLFRAHIRPNIEFPDACGCSCFAASKARSRTHSIVSLAFYPAHRLFWIGRKAEDEYKSLRRLHKTTTKSLQYFPFPYLDGSSKQYCMCLHCSNDRYNIISFLHENGNWTDATGTHVELLSLVSRDFSCGGLVLVFWLDAVYEIAALYDVGEMGKAAQLAPAFLCALTEFEHHI